MTNSREILLEMLYEILEKGTYSHLLLKSTLDKYSYLDKRERSFIHRVCQGTIERTIEIDYIINQFSKVSVKKMKPVIRTIMRMSAYQILFMEQIPDSAACNEAVKLANKKGFYNLKGFVNGVLRNISRQKDNITYPTKETDLCEFYHITYSMPKWIVERFMESFGNDKTEIILKGLLEERPLTIRIDERLEQKEREVIVQQIVAANIKLQPCEKLDYAYYVTEYENVQSIPGFLDGKVMISDLGSMLITEFAHIEKGDKVLDVCGAPGGKALHSASKVGESGQVIVRDLSEYKANLIRENLHRTGYNNVDIQVWDATVLNEDTKEWADVVIADLPCSGLGVIGRKADIKYRLNESDICDIANLQKEILKTISVYVKKEGTLLYSTCTLTREENQDNVAYIKKLGFRLLEEKELLPGIDKTDGFYMARFYKEG